MVMQHWRILMKIAILTSPNQWFVPYASLLQKQLADSNLFFEHEKIDEVFDVLFILSYHKIIEEKYLQHKHNIVIHASALPQGKGWAPLFWQILEGKNEIPFSMFEAGSGVDDGDIYMQKTLSLTGFELNAELREKQAFFTTQMCLDFLSNYEAYKLPSKQTGEESFYPKRGAKDSKLDINKSIKEQFNLLRIVDNDSYPAFFEIDGHTYKLTIEELKNENR
jgi:methionyl-tRNA formyltransferase